MFTCICGKCSQRMLFLCFSTQINLRHVFKMSAFGTYACFESWMSLVNGCINCALFNAMPNVYLHNWKDWVIQQTKINFFLNLYTVLSTCNEVTFSCKYLLSTSLLFSQPCRYRSRNVPTFIKLSTPLLVSAACERLFSAAGRVFVHRRGRISDKRFEQQLLAYSNKHLL